MSVSPRPLRVLVLAPHPFFQDRGTPIAVRALLEVLVGRGYRVDVITFHEGSDPGIPGCTILRTPRLPGLDGIRPGFSGKKLLSDAFLAARALARVPVRGYDLVHAVEESVFVAAAGRLLFGVPYVYDMDSSLAQQMMEKYPVLTRIRPVLEGLEGLAVRRSTSVVAVCEALVETARRHAPATPVARVEDFSLLDQGEDGSEDLRERTGFAGPVALYVGNLERYQGVDLLLESLPHALREVPEGSLAVIGGAPADVERYRQKAAGLGLGPRVAFLGPRPVSQLGWYLRQADVVVSPRIVGGNTPMKVYSYLDSGRALLATRLPTHTQVLDEEIALLADPDPAAVGAALARLFRDPALREELGARARERVRREYSREAYRRKMNAFYDGVEEVLGARSRSD